LTFLSVSSPLQKEAPPVSLQSTLSPRALRDDTVKPSPPRCDSGDRIINFLTFAGIETSKIHSLPGHTSTQALLVFVSGITIALQFYMSVTFTESSILYSKQESKQWHILNFEYSYPTVWQISRL
jgi:hypothetical protein